MSPRGQLHPNNQFYYHQAGQTTCPGPVNIFIMGNIYPKIMCPKCVHTKLPCSALYSEIFLHFIYQYVKYHISTIHILNKGVHKLVSIYLDQSFYQKFIGILHERLLRYICSQSLDWVWQSGKSCWLEEIECSSNHSRRFSLDKDLMLFFQVSCSGTTTLMWTMTYWLDMWIYVDMSHLLLLGKFEYTGGPIFKVVLEC